MSISFEFLGVSEFGHAIEKIVAESSVQSRAATKAAGELVKNRAQAELTRQSHAKRTSTPSRPGSPPAKVSGALAASLRVEPPVPMGATKWECRVGPTLLYGRIQELGGVTGRHGSVRLPPRPYLSLALGKVLDSGELFAKFYEAWQF